MDSTPGSLRSTSEDIARLAKKASSSALHYTSTSGKGLLRGLQALADHLQSVLSSISITSARRRSRRKGLPLPLPTTIKGPDCVGKIIELLEEVSTRLLCRLHDIHKNLQFWKARAQGPDTHKVTFMVLERGPCAFLQGIAKLLYDCVWESSATAGLVTAAVSQISTRAKLLSTLQCRLATVLGEVYQEADRFGEGVIKGRNSEAVTLALLAINKAIVSLEGSYDLNQMDYSGGVGEKGRDIEVPNMTFQFKKLPAELLEKRELTDAEISMCTNVIIENMAELDDCLSALMQNYRKPRRATRLWLRYTGGAVGLALVSGWLIQHSPIMGSRDLENWLKQGGEAVIAFTKEHVEGPLLSIRDDLFETFRRRHHGVAELEDVKLTADSLHRMLKAFAEQSKGQAAASNLTEQELMAIVMNRYEKEITHPLQSLIGGELFRAMLIQVQKLKLDIETAMLELNQILRANEINFAVLAALPAFLFAILLGWLLRLSLLRDKDAEGQGIAHVHRRMLLAEVERTIMSYQILTDEGKVLDEGKEDPMMSYYGMTIYLLDQFYRAVERHALKAGEWTSLQGDIIDLSKPKIGLSHKLAITARMERIYECIIPARSV